MIRSTKARKQRVVMRYKQREEVKRLIRRLMTRTAVIMLLVGFGLGMATHGETFFTRFIQHHTPELVVRAPQALAGLPFRQQLPGNPFWLWFPGVGKHLNGKITAKYAEVRRVHLERHFLENCVVVLLEPRKPVVRWGDRGLDESGALFPLTQQSWSQLPKAVFPESEPPPSRVLLGQWFVALSQVPSLWNNVVAVTRNNQGDLLLSLQSGAEVIWGPPDPEKVVSKAQQLARVLEDAHHRLGGAARADVRFFDEGRIIVRPKGVAI